jgi:hypothetical protein
MQGHCGFHRNDYPILDESSRTNPHCLLYLDSRMSAALIISEDALECSLAERIGRSLRLWFSGRFERLNGAADSVRLGICCLERGLDIEMHLYGKGGLRPEMECLVEQAAAATGMIHVHELVTYQKTQALPWSPPLLQMIKLRPNRKRFVKYQDLPYRSVPMIVGPQDGELWPQ